MIFFDFETCGFHGMPVLLQWQEDDGKINLHHIWYTPIGETLKLIEYIVNHEGGVCGFNLAFDWFHMCKLYTVFSQYHDYDAIPLEIIDEIAELEMSGRDGPALKPVKAMDLMLHARQGPYQSTMDRKDIRIKKVPTQLAWQLAAELEKRVPLKDVYFARKKDKKAEKWRVLDITEIDGKISTDFKDVVLSFAPSAALKALAQDALGVKDDDILLFTDVEVDRKFLPIECGWAPWAKSTKFATKDNWQGTWPEVIHHHARHWKYNTLAQKYATKDVEYTHGLFDHFGQPEAGDDNSELACMVAAVRWKGFKIDIEMIKELRMKSFLNSKKAVTAPAKVKEYLFPLLSKEEQMACNGSTNKEVLERLDKLTTDCPDCEASGSVVDPNTQQLVKCGNCKNGEIRHPVAYRAREVIEARAATKEMELYDKLIQAGRLHAGFKVIGALSGRMSGDSGLNPQAVKRTKEVRRCFRLAPDGYELCGGDFESFEIMIAIADYNDPQLYKDVTEKHPCPVCHTKGVLDKFNKKKGITEYGIKCEECDGTGEMKKKIHGLFAEALFPEEDYESILLTKGEEDDLYGKGKTGVFSQLFGGDDNTLVRKVHINKQEAQEASERWQRRYPGVKRAQKKILDDFQSMKQPEGFGRRVYWHDPKEKIESMLGFPRYFTLENSISKALFDLAEKPPKAWEAIKIKVTRRDREQWATGAVRSALFGAAFGIQGCNVRAATNHRIQSTGAGITKRLQRRIWDLQPCGIHEFKVIPMNIHDEVHAPCLPEMVSSVTSVVNETVDHYKSVVPLLSIAWGEKLNTWADK